MGGGLGGVGGGLPERSAKKGCSEEKAGVGSAVGATRGRLPDGRAGGGGGEVSMAGEGRGGGGGDVVPLAEGGEEDKRLGLRWWLLCEGVGTRSSGGGSSSPLDRSMTSTGADRWRPGREEKEEEWVPLRRGPSASTKRLSAWW